MRSLALCALLLFSSPAFADEMRYPATGSPAVTFKVPDGWSAKDVNGKIQTASADGSTTVTIAIVPYMGSVDALAEETFKAQNIDPPRASDRHAASVVDMTGYWWPSFQIGADGKTRRVFFCDVILGGGKALTGTLISPDDEGPDYHAGLHILDRMALAHD